MPAPNRKHKSNSVMVNILTFGIISVLTFCTINIAFTYLILWKRKFTMMKEQISVPDDWFSFRTEYLYHSPALDLMSTSALALMLGFLLSLRLAEKRKFRNNAKDVKGDARWATKREIIRNKDFANIDINHLSEEQSAGIPLCRFKNKYIVDTSTTHSMVLGCTRSGKTQTLVMYMLYIIAGTAQKQNVVVNDPKGELLETSYKFFKDNGYEIVILNLREPQISNTYNPLSIIIDDYVDAMQTKQQDLSVCLSDLNELTSAITFNDKSDPIWPESAKALLNAMILYLLEACYITGTLDSLSLYAVKTFFIEYGNTTKDQNGNEVNRLDELLSSLPAGHPAKSAYATSRFSTGDTRSSIFTTLSNSLELWTDEGICRMTAGNDIRVNRIVSSGTPQAIFMVIPDDRKERHKLASIFVNQLYQAMVEYLTKNRLKKMSRRWNFVLDEFANMVKIPNASEKMTVSAGRNIIFHLFIQSFSQLDDVYEKQSQAIRDSCGNLIYIYSMSADTNKYFSELLASTTLEYATYSGTLSEYQKNRSQHLESKPLMSADELSLMQPGEMIVCRQRMRPIFAKFEFFYKLGYRDISISEFSPAPRENRLSDYIPDYEKLIAAEQRHSEELVKDKDKNGKKTETLNLEDVYNKFVFLNPNVTDDACKEQSISQPTTKKKKVSPLKDAFDTADELTNGQFSELLNERKYAECSRLLNRLCANDKDFKEQHYKRLSEVIINRQQ